MKHKMRTFKSGATRDDSEGKPDFEGFLSPLVIERFGEYMDKHRKQADGGLRDSDNWQKGIPRDQYIKSAFRHFVKWWKLHRATVRWHNELEEALCGLLFNVQGYLHEHLKDKQKTQELVDDFDRNLKAKQRSAEEIVNAFNADTEIDEQERILT